MTILRLDLQAGGWRAVPPQMFADHRLSLDTRGVAGFIATRSDSFTLRVSGLCVLLDLGEDKWRRINRELESAGYLKRIEGKDERGRFRHELLFSPIPDGGFPEKPSGLSAVKPPKKPVEPGAAKAGTAKPVPAKSWSTIKPVDQISEDHHQHPPGGGSSDLRGPEPPSAWLEAAEYEIGVEEQRRPIKNRGGLLQKIIQRYQTNGGPDNFIQAALKAKKVAEAKQEAQTEAENVRIREESERARVEAERIAMAEAKAIELSIEERLNLVLIAEKTTSLKASKKEKEAFVEHGTLLCGPIRLALVRLLMSP